VAVLLLAHGSNCCCRFFGPRYWWNLITFDLVPIFGRDFLETLLRLEDDNLDVAAVDAAYSINFNTLSMHGVSVILYLEHICITTNIKLQDK